MRIFCLLALLCPMLSMAQVSPSNASLLKGQIRAAHTAEYLQGAVVYLRSNNKRTITDKEGRFQLSISALPDTLVISYTGYTTLRLAVNSYQLPNILLEPSAEELATVEVQTGYQSLPAERATGSFTKINTDLFNRKVGASILDRLDGIASGLIFNRNRTPNANESAIQIRGRSTIFANTEPLIVVDNFPFEGDINQLNPNDIESVTLLKDAAASSIWGVRAGNGVIVITTKKAKQSSAPKLRFNTNITIGEKPDLYYQPIADASALIEMESFLFGRGYYNNRINQRFAGLSPAVVIFDDRRNGRITAADSATQIQQLLQTDNRSDLLRYFYRPSVAQQYALNISGGSERAQYYFSAGWDKQQQSQLQSDLNRFTLRNKTQIQLIRDKLDFSTDLNMIMSTNNNPSSAYSNNYSVYQDLVDDQGAALPVYRDYRKAWLDTIGQGQLLPWLHKPYEEIRFANHKTSRLDTRMLTSLLWRIRKGLQVQMSYQLETGNSETRNLQSMDQFFTRDLINRYTLPNYVTGIPTNAIPFGDILNKNDQRLVSHNGRIQVNYRTSWKQNHVLDLLGGMEIRDITIRRSGIRRYGVNESIGLDQEINPISTFPTLPNALASRIPTNTTNNQTADRFLSQFMNLGYSYHNRYQFTFSARRDASNLFGVEANQKTVPLWSVGAGWMVHKENWWKSGFLNTLKFRLTYGVSGNIDKAATAYTTAGSDINSFFSQPTAYLINPPNPELSWEKIHMLNAGIDFSVLNGRIDASLEYYVKNGKNLLGASPMAPQTGVTQFRQNIADLQTKGIDLTLNALIMQRSLQWSAQLLFSYNRDIIQRYLVPAALTKFYLTNITTNPYEGKPWSAIFAYPMAGLESNTGNPLGLLDNATSTNYSRLVNPASKDEFMYIGSGRPTFFGGLRNDISYQGFTLSVNMVYSMGYYFRRPSVLYTTAFSSSLSATPSTHADYARRWKVPGDEMFTTIPSMVYPAVPARDEFYQYSNTLIEKGDHIRLRDIRFGWRLPIQKNNPLRIQSCRVYAYVNNIGILWRSNKAGIDPDNITGFPSPRTYALGLEIDF
ncbi:SusC/RagA family TonB-linked outer membrane protein [Sediminibacterium goheungense]|uniref:TonB-linked SusC/RagA family outer membrane protein n=1 Tax=Sediminibacterium goheungense TaxID=1086393 RepID=A0A4R6IW35_9BACT|nr:SusC/RagA family TonB-linked outer membrane protein [Sediminibacterium goheungense]TDO26567.1 TonB-linked SusC/RagA family outer membrane protein [Sediminibacterium goheungense]